MSNIEIYNAYLAGEWTGELPQPRPIREELYLAAMCGLDVGELPPPRPIRNEMYLYELAVNGGGTGGVELPELTNPAGAAHILKDYEAIGPDGAVIVGGLVMPEGELVITDANYLFYKSARVDCIPQLLAACKGVTSAVSMFYDCIKLTELDLSGFDTSRVTSMLNMFYNCRALVELDLSNFNTGQVTDMGSMFYGCSKLTTLNLSGFDTSNVTLMANMFFGCSKLTELDLSGFDTSQVTDMGSMFQSCFSLTELDLSGFDTSQVTNMGSMFYGCSGLTELDLSGFDTSQVTNMSHMFNGCDNLVELDLSSFDTSQVATMPYMFNGCRKLAILDLSGFDTVKVTNMSSMFSSCPALEEIIGFSATNKAGLSIGFPFGTASAPMALKRLTFKDCGDTPSIRSAINIKFCSMLRSGFVEMAESLPDLTTAGSISSSYKTITITGNPCVLDEIALTEANFMTANVTYEKFCDAAIARYRGLDYQKAPIAYYLTGQTASNVVTTTFDAVTEEMVEAAGGITYRFLADTITIPEADRITDSDRAIALNKGWQLVEA